MKVYATTVWLSLLALVLAASGCTQQGSLPAAPSDSTLYEIQQRGTLIVGSDVPYGLMEFYNEEGDIAGLEIDIAREIARELGVELDVRDTGWEELFTQVQSGELDIAISSMTITPERSEKMLFSIPYFNGGQTIVVRSTDISIKRPEDLAGKKVGAQVDTTSLAEAQTYAGEDFVVSYEDYSVSDATGTNIWDDLESGDLDAIIVDYVVANEIVVQRENLELAGDPFTQEFYGIPTKLENEHLIEAINEILRDMKRDGRLQEIQKNWLE